MPPFVIKYKIVISLSQKIHDLNLNVVRLRYTFGYVDFAEYPSLPIDKCRLFKITFPSLCL